MIELLRRPVVGLILIFFMSVVVVPVHGADLSSDMLPSSSASSSKIKLDPEYYKIARDGGIGLGIGGLAGFAFVMLSRNTIGSPGAYMTNDTMVSSLVAGLLGGIIAGIWQVKHDQALALSLAPANSSTPATVKTSLSF